jgi:hypothetical protein
MTAHYFLSVAFHSMLDKHRSLLRDQSAPITAKGGLTRCIEELKNPGCRMKTIVYMEV